LGKKWNSCPSQPDAVKQGKTKETTKKLNELAWKPWRSEALGACSGTGRSVEEWL
jgi:hypothetical protein